MTHRVCSRQWSVRWLCAVALISAGCAGDTAPSAQPSATPAGSTSAPAAAGATLLNTIVGRPTATSIAVSVLCPVATEVYVEYGTASGRYTANTPTATALTADPVVLTLTGLTADTRYFYRVRTRGAADASFRADTEHQLQTQRGTGRTFSFGVQGDSHPERAGQMFNAALYTRNMQNVAAAQHDFYIALGDDFSVEPLLDRNALSQSAVDALYLNQRTYFGIPGVSTPVFLVNGNHEQAAAYLVNGRFPTPWADAPVFQGLARLRHFALPAPDGFYAGDAEPQPGVGLLRDYYAWEWGDALFVTIDPYWHSPVPVDNGVPGVDKTKDTWQSTIGDAQYAWLTQVLQTSRAPYKFIFQHHVLGTFRGAAAIVHQFEWGGYNKAGTAWEFSAQRPGWAKPLHQLFRDTGVTVVFSAHDHVYAREQVDGIVYQSVPNPADDTYTAFNADAYLPVAVSLPGARYDPKAGTVQPNAGHLSVTVSPQQATVRYVRAVQPGDDAKAGASNGSVSATYTVTPARVASPVTTLHTTVVTGAVQ